MTNEEEEDVMTMETLDQHNKQISDPVTLYKVAMLTAVFLIMAAGCATYQEKVKTYLKGQEQTLSYPLRQVMLASGKALGDTDFAVQRMEFTDQGGLIQARARHKEATLRFTRTGPQTTRLHVDMFTKERSRDIAAEEALIHDISGLLTRGDAPSLSTLTAHMIPVSNAPGASGRIVAYVAQGTVVSITSDQDEWSRVALLSRGFGYIHTRNLEPAPNQIHAENH